MQKELSKIANVTTVSAYCHEDLETLPNRRIDQLKDGKWDWVVLGSSSIAQQWVKLTHGIPHGKIPKIAAISPITADMVAKLGAKADLIAQDYTFAGVAKALAGFKEKDPGTI